MGRRAKLVVAPAAEELAENAPGADEGEELFEEELPPQVVTTVSVPRSSPPSNELPLFPGLPAATARMAAKLRLERITPTSAAGYLGELDPATSEEDIRRSFGGRTFKVCLVNGMRRVMGGTNRTIEIDAEPKRPDDDGRAPRAAVDVEAVVRRVVDPLREEMERAKATAKLEIDAERERRRLDAEEREAKAKREQAEADAKHRRELEALEARARSDAERERQRFELEMKREEQRAQAALAQQREMIGMVIKSSENNTNVLVATMNAKAEKAGGIGDLAAMAELVTALRGGDEDPSVKMFGKLTEGLGSFAKMVTHEGRPHALPVGHAPGAQPSGVPVATSRPVVSNPAPSPAAAPGTLPPPTPQTLPDDLQAIMADMIASGLKPEEIVRAIRERKILLVPADEYADEFEEGEEDEELPPPRRTRAAREVTNAPDASPSDTPSASSTPPTGGPAA